LLKAFKNASRYWMVDALAIEADIVPAIGADQKSNMADRPIACGDPFQRPRLHIHRFAGSQTHDVPVQLPIGTGLPLARSSKVCVTPWFISRQASPHAFAGGRSPGAGLP
jgi:hypothetical protein